MASFANRKGGFIVFGVSDNPRSASGLENAHFENTDEEVITNYLNSIFSPEIVWEKRTCSIQGKKFGIIYTCESMKKPIIAKSNATDIKESDIFYRYNGRSERIKYPELRMIIDSEREKEKHLWMKHMQKISKIGIDNNATIELGRNIINNGKNMKLKKKKPNAQSCRRLTGQ